MKSINLKENQFIQFHQKISFKFDAQCLVSYSIDRKSKRVLALQEQSKREDDALNFCSSSKLGSQHYKQCPRNLPIHTDFVEAQVHLPN